MGYPTHPTPLEKSGFRASACKGLQHFQCKAQYTCNIIHFVSFYNKFILQILTYRKKKKSSRGLQHIQSKKLAKFVAF